MHILHISRQSKVELMLKYLAAAACLPSKLCSSHGPTTATAVPMLDGLLLIRHIH